MSHPSGVRGARMERSSAVMTDVEFVTRRGLCVLGRLALVCRKALFLRREWPRIEPRTVFSTMFDHLRADSSLHRRCNGDCAPQIVAAAGKNDLHAVAHKRVN